MATRTAIERFLAEKRLAVVGVSQDPRDFSRSVLKELRGHGYDVVVVHPTARTIDGHACTHRMQEIWPPVRAALLLTRPSVTETVVRDCAEAEVDLVWMHRGSGEGAVSDEAVAYCREHGIDVVPGACPFMFLPRAGFVHRLHGGILALLGRKPH